MIHALLQYGQDRGLICKPGFRKKEAFWLLDFSPSGEFLGVLPLASNRRPRPFENVPDLSQGEMVALRARQKGASQFLLSPLGDFLGFAKAGENQSKRIQDHRVCLELLGACGCDGIVLVANVLAKEEVRNRAIQSLQGLANPRPTADHNATLRIGGRFALEMTGWQGWWDQFRATLVKPRKRNLRTFVCFATGLPVIPAKTHGKTYRLGDTGANRAGAALITFDKNAFESYGLRQGENCAMSEQTTKDYVSAVDQMLDQSIIYRWKHAKAKTPAQLSPSHPVLGGARIAYWYTGPAETRIEVEQHHDLIGLVLGSESRDEPPPEDVEEERVLAEGRLRQAVDRIRSGESAQPIGNVRFCILALSGAGGRVMVRDFVEGTVLRLAETTERWFDDLGLDTYWGRPGYPPSLERVLTSPLPEKRHDQDYLKWVAPAGAWRQSLWHAALTGGSLPDTAFARALLAHNNTVVSGELTDDKEGPSARRLSHLRLALVKAYLIRKGVIMDPALDPEHPSPAYHCGRLLAVYDSLQRAALGEVGAGIIQRYYGGALTNPSGVFGQLSRLAQTHLSKLEGGLAHIYDTRISEIHNGIRRRGDCPASYPPALNLDDQALFALGFWHQTAAINKEKAEAAAAKKAREANAQNS